jgi:hypothetical protein
LLDATSEEVERVTEYFQSQAPDLKVTFVQKVYSETLINSRHDVWDIHTDKDRWWIIGGPMMNLYSQEDFPNMDLALTFHVGLCIRVPRSEHQKVSDIPAEPFEQAVRNIKEAHEALAHAEEVADYQAIGVRCRQALLAFVDVVQIVIPWVSEVEPEPQGHNFKAWAEHICSVALHGRTHKDRRQLFKTTLESAWGYSNWLAHDDSTNWYDAEAAVSISDLAFGLAMSVVLRHIRGVPDVCPSCGSHRLSPERGIHTSIPDVLWERPTCDKCGWEGKPVPVNGKGGDDDEAEEDERPRGDCVIPTVPLRKLRKPGDK